jgi:hypothetical protein
MNGSRQDARNGSVCVQDVVLEDGKHAHRRRKHQHIVTVLLHLRQQLVQKYRLATRPYKDSILSFFRHCIGP